MPKMQDEIAQRNYNKRMSNRAKGCKITIKVSIPEDVRKIRTLERIGDDCRLEGRLEVITKKFRIANQKM